MKRNKIIALALVCISLVVSFISTKSFLSMHEPELIIKGPGVTSVKMLSDYFPKLKGSNGDTEIYILEGEKPGSSLLILGGNHPNEPSGNLTAIGFIEKAIIGSGTVYVIPRANNSAFTHNDAQEAWPQLYSIETKGTERTFRFGSRYTNPIDQWPDPDIYVHASSGQTLSGKETRNLNRAFPGKEDGSLTEQVGYGITKMINDEKIDITIDLHEASPEYPVIDAMVAHDEAMPIASMAVINMGLQGVKIGLEPSPTNLRGLSHRELGDHTDTLAILLETAEPVIGRYRGKTDVDLVLEGKDPFYVRAAELGQLYVPFDEDGHPIEERVGRHILSIFEIVSAYNLNKPDEPLVIENMPDYDTIIEQGVGILLNPLN